MKQFSLTTNIKKGKNYKNWEILSKMKNHVYKKKRGSFLVSKNPHLGTSPFAIPCLSSTLPRFIYTFTFHSLHFRVFYQKIWFICDFPKKIITFYFLLFLREFFCKIAEKIWFICDFSKKIITFYFLLFLRGNLLMKYTD